jgi:nitrate/nitrite-specific signal transduction histidine kinase
VRLSLPRVLTIRSKLLLYFVCIVAFTALAISGITAAVEVRGARDRVVAQLKSVATLKGQEVDSWIGGLSLNLDIVLSSQGVTRDLHTLTVDRPGSPAYRAAYRRVLARFDWASQRMGLFEELFFMGPKGQVILSTDAGHERQQLGMNDYFTRGMTGHSIEEPSYSLALNEMTVVASRPVAEQGPPFGVLAGRANLDSLNDVMIGRAGLGGTGETYLVGSNHRLLTDLRHPGYSVPAAYIRTFGADAAVDRGRNGSATYRGYAGDKVIGVFDWIPRLRVALIAEQQEGEALHTATLALWTTGGVALLAAVIAIAVGSIFIHSITRPLSELGETASRIADGEIDLDASVTRDDEIGTLARSFNRMTGQLRELVHSLEKRTHHLRAINDAGRQISSILDLETLLPYVANSLLRTFDYDSVRIFLLDGEDGGRLLICDRQEGEQTSVVAPEDLGALPAVASVVRSGEAVTRMEATADGSTAGSAFSEIAVPIRVGNQLAGVLGITSTSDHPLDEQDRFAATTLADQLAIAVENTRLYQSAHELAAARERQRLARDLHDAVSQTLFSVSLIAEVLPRVYERDPALGRERLEELRQLTRGALAEMRMLLLELRPAALAEAKLPDLLKQLTEAVIGRWRIPVDLRLETTVDIPAEVRVALYRIAQEALNNVAKHSGAERAVLSLRDEQEIGREGLELIVQDDGCGFDPDQTEAGRLGLGIMAERAESIGAQLEIESSHSDGTRVRVVWRASSCASSQPAPGSPLSNSSRPSF